MRHVRCIELMGSNPASQGMEHSHVAVANLILAGLYDTLPLGITPGCGLPCRQQRQLGAAQLSGLALLTGGSLALMPTVCASIGPLIRSAGVTAALLTGDELEGMLEVQHRMQRHPAIEYHHWHLTLPQW